MESKAFILKKPIAFFVFNRPEVTQAVFERIALAKPPVLLLIADGPRSHVANEAEKCARVRQIISSIDWPCEIHKNFSEQNLGCKRRLSSGLDWVFSTVEEAIVLEDDCLPEPSFFRFCEEMLDRYRDDERVMMVSGDCFLPPDFPFGGKKGGYSYYFSRNPHIWGWASWRRAWEKYDLEMKLWPELKSIGFLNDLLPDEKSVKYWTNTFDAVYSGKVNTWDFQWHFAQWVNHGFSIAPAQNLITNIGFGVDATHTTQDAPGYSNLKTSPLSFPLMHPPFFYQRTDADNWVQKNVIDVPRSLWTRVKSMSNKIKQSI